MIIATTTLSFIISLLLLFCDDYNSFQHVGTKNLRSFTALLLYKLKKFQNMETIKNIKNFHIIKY